MKKIFILFLLFGLVLDGFAFSFHRHSSKRFVKGVSTDNLLALSWQNAFCQTHKRKRECRSVDMSSYTASHFTLHGLWPQPRSKTNCKSISKAWLDKDIYSELSRVMPGVKSGLFKHEWKKHGTCYGKDINAYYRDSIFLVDRINNSEVQKLFAKNIGKILTKKEIMQAFDKSFGKGSGRKVQMICKHGLITELHINLKGEIEPGVDITTLLNSAKNARGGCLKGKVDEVGIK